jgi:hypothetical protein
MSYSLDAQEQVPITGNITLYNLANGLHNITVYAKDKFEIIGVSETIHFNIDPPEPFPTTLIVAVSAASVAVVALGLVVYFRKLKGRK